MLKIEQMENNNGLDNIYSIKMDINGIKIQGIFHKIDIDEHQLTPMKNGLLIEDPT